MLLSKGEASAAKKPTYGDKCGYCRILLFTCKEKKFF